jgi:hypothetical protein
MVEIVISLRRQHGSEAASKLLWVGLTVNGYPKNCQISICRIQTLLGSSALGAQVL